MLVKALVIASACSRTPQARCPSLPLTGVTCRDLRISLAPAYSLTHQPSECVATKARARTCRNAKISCSSALSRSVNPPPAASPPFFTSSMEPDLPSSFGPPKLTVRSQGQQGRTDTHTARTHICGWRMAAAAPDASIAYAHLPSSSAPLEKRVYSWLEYTCTGMCWMHSRIKVSKSLLQYAMNLRAHAASPTARLRQITRCKRTVLPCR